jgi:hypothetical protein
MDAAVKRHRVTESRPRTEADDDIPAVDTAGRAITDDTCAACGHATLRAQQACEPGRRCVQDVYARRIANFFSAHPLLAAGHLQHPYFEVRAIASRHADVFHLTPLMADPDETVRLQVALRVPQRLLLRMRDDPHREVRIRVAHRIAVDHLATMRADADYQVRCIVAQRLPEALLPLMMTDVDLQVRLEIARRVTMPAMWRLTDDPAPEVRRIAAARLPVALLAALADDPDWTVRWEAAGRADGSALQRLLADAEADVRERAVERMRLLAATTAESRATGTEPLHV